MADVQPAELATPPSGRRRIEAVRASVCAKEASMRD